MGAVDDDVRDRHVELRAQPRHEIRLLPVRALGWVRGDDHLVGPETPQVVLDGEHRMHRIADVATDVDREMDQARERLALTLDWARTHGLRARGHIGDPMHPMLAVEDDLRRFGPDEVIVATHPAESTNWQETDLMARLRAELDVPVTHVVVDRVHHHLEIVP